MGEPWTSCEFCGRLCRVNDLVATPTPMPLYVCGDCLRVNFEGDPAELDQVIPPQEVAVEDYAGLYGACVTGG